MKIKTEIINGKELVIKFRKASKTVQDRIDKALMKAGLLVERSAKMLVHVDTGRLRASITTRLVPSNVQVGTNVIYAPYIEFGTGIYAEGGKGRQTPWVYKDRKGWHFTHGSRPNPFLRPALKSNEAKIEIILHKGLSDAMNDIFKKGFTKIF